MLIFLLQDTSRDFSSVLEEAEVLTKLDIKFRTFGIIPFTNIVTGIDDILNSDNDDQYIIRCGTKMVELIITGCIDNCTPNVIEKFKKAISYNTNNFDQKFYNKLNLPLLNSEITLLDLSNDVDLYASFDVPKFVKPTSDLKAFTAGIMEEGTVLKYYIENSYHNINYTKSYALCSSVKCVYEEYRFICLNSEVLAGSQYKDQYKFKKTRNIPNDVMNCAYEYAKLYQPSDLYSMDLCRTDEGIKIVEYNAWNCSGLYDIDCYDLFKKIYDYKINED